MSQPPTHSPQRAQMIDPSMVRTLDFQARAIWPQEEPLLRRLPLAPDARILDAGCGTGELLARAADLFPQAHLLGVELEEVNVAFAQRRLAPLAPRVQVQQGDIFHLDLPPDTFDLTLCRHVLQAVPRPADALDALIRVTRPGGYLHLLVEDYGMMFFSAEDPRIERFWTDVVLPTGRATETDLHIGRHAWSLLRARGLEDVAIDYVHVDTTRTPRPWFAGIWSAWRDGYVDFLAAHSGRPAQEIRDTFDAMIACIEDERAYALWLVPIVSARRPSAQ